MKTEIALLRCDSYEQGLVQESVKKAIDSLGGIEKFIAPQSRCLVKPNLLMAKEPEFGVTTHPEVLRAVVKMLKGIGCRIMVGDGPSVWGGQIENVDEVYERTGTKRICEEEGVELVKFDKNRWREKFTLTTRLDEVDHVISIPKFKTHEFTILTGALKNLFGFVGNSYKTELHKKYFEPSQFAGIIADIYQEVRPALTVIDGIVAMEADGPATGGKLRDAGLILAGSDCVALDSVLAVIMGLLPTDIPAINEAVLRGAGTADINDIKVKGMNLAEALIEGFQLPKSSIVRKIPRPIANIAKNLIRFYPKPNHNRCIRCGACVKVCPKKVISFKRRKISIDYSGCISCFCCQEVCPVSAMEIKKSLFAKMVGL